METLTTQQLWDRLDAVTAGEAPQAMTDVAHWLFGVADDALSRNDSQQYVFAAFWGSHLLIWVQNQRMRNHKEG